MALKPLEPGGSLPSEAALGMNTPSELGQSIVAVEKATKRLLPSTITAALAQSGLDEKSLTRAAQIVAKNFDLDPSYFWGTSTPSDPYTGGPLSLATFRRITEDAKPDVLKAMAPSLFAMQSTDERVMERPWLTNMNAGKLSQVLRAAGPVLAPFHIAAHEGVALAAEVLRQGANGKRFAQNLQAVIGWYNLDKNSLMKGRELDWVALSNIALEASVAKRNLTSPVDVRAFLYPEIADKARKGSRAEANAAASESNAMYAGGKGTDWLNVSSDLTPVARAFLAGDYTNPEVKKFLDEKFGNAEEIAKARDIVRRQALIEEARRIQAETTVTTMGIGGGGRGASEIRDVEGLAEAKELLSRGSPDWYKGAEVLEQEVLDSKTAFQRSFVGRAVTGAAGIVMGLYEAVQLGIVNTAALSVPVLDALGQDEMAQDYSISFSQYRQQIKTGDGVFAAMGQKLGWHPAVGTSLDFLVSWYLDPTIIAGKSIGAYRGLKYAPELVVKRTFVEAAVAKIPGFEELVSKRVAARLAQQTEDFIGSIGKFSSRNAESLAKALATGEPGAIREFIQKFGTHIQTGNALDEALLQKAQRLFKARYPAVTDEAVKEAEHLLQSLFGVKVRPGSLAEAAWMTRASAESKAIAVADQMPTIQGRVYAQTDSGLLLPEATAKDLVDDAIRRHVLNLGQLEVPYARRLQTARNVIRNADIVNEPGVISTVERKLAQTFGLNPGNVLNINEDPARWAKLVATRAGNFTPREVDSIVDAMNKATIGGNPEASIRSVVETRIIDPVLKAEAKSLNVPDNLVPVIREELDRALGKWRQELFGVVEGKNVRSPLLETQRVDELVFPDVLQVKKFVRTFANVHADLLESSPSWMRKYAAESSELWAKHVTPVSRAVMRTWKTLVVPRGGYVGRVVLLDEGLGRWFGTGFSLLERAAATNVDEAVGALIKAGTLGATPRAAARFIGKGVAKPVEAVSDWLHVADEFRFGDDIVRLETPRSSIAYEPLANTTSRQSEVIEDLMRRATQVTGDLKFRGQWGIVEPKAATYYPALQHALNNQIGQSIPGRLALEAVRDGKSVIETRNLLMSWGRRNGKSYLAQMGWAAEDVEEWATLLSKMVHGYTVGNKEVAAMALERAVGDDVLRKIPRDALPNIHGPLLQEATFGNSALNMKRVTEYWYDTFVRMPENTLNRQPYYKAWKRRAERAYYAMAEAQYGKSASALDDSLRIIDNADGTQTLIGWHFNPKGRISPHPDRNFYFGTKQSALDRAEGFINKTEPGTMFQIEVTGKFSDYRRLTEAEFAAENRAGRIPLKDLNEKFDGHLFTASIEDPGSVAVLLNRDKKALIKATPIEELAGAVPLDELKAAIDQASRDFALKQVKRIMFDFSENSRIGELLYGVFPFLQPYTEAFSVYGHILYHRNPAMLGYANRVWELGKASGFIRKDEQSGEWVIPTSWWSGADTALRMLAGVKGAEVLTPVRSLNLFASSAVKLPDDAPLIGGASIPVPSLSPLAMLIFQRAFKNTESDAISSWLFAYGPNVQLVPTSLGKFLTATFPEMYDDGVLNAIAMDYIIDYQYRGIYQDLTLAELQAQALSDARQHMMTRALLSFNGIGTSLVRWEWAPIRQEYFDLIEQFGGDTQKAKEAFLTKYPAYGAMTVGKTKVGSGLAFVDEEGMVVPGASGLRLPASDYARRFLNSPAGKELIADGFTPLLGALLLQADKEAQGNDFSTYSQYIAQGLIKTKELIDYIADVEQAGLAGANPLVVDEHEGFWGAVTSFNEYQRAKADLLRSQGHKEGDARFQELSDEKSQFLYSLKDHFPASYRQYLNEEASESDPSQIVRVTWKFGTDGSGEPSPVTIAKIRQFAAIPQIQGFNAVKGLNYYLPELDRIRSTMIEEGIDSIEDTGAIELGLDKEYQAVLDKLEADYPEAAYIVNNFLRNVLTSEPTKGEVTLRTWKKANDPRYRQYLDFEDEYTDLAAQVDEVGLEYQKSQVYTQMTQLFSRTYQASPDVIQAWWDRKSYGEREQYKDGLITKYIGYMNTFDLGLLGIPVGDTTASQLATIATQRSAAQAIQYQAARDGRDFDREAVYGPIERMELAFATSNPEYMKVLNAQRTWGYALDQSEYVQGDHRAAYIWRNVSALVHATQMWATSNKLTGSVYGSRENKAEYLKRRELLIAVVNGYKQQDNRFAAEWDYLEGRVSDPLINYFMPDYYFDYPLGPVSPRQAA